MKSSVTVFDTTLLWSFDSYLNGSHTYKDIRSQEVAIRVFEHLLNYQKTLTFILPSSVKGGTPKEILNEIGHVPLSFRYLLNGDVLEVPDKDWNAQKMPDDSSILRHRLHKFLNLAHVNPLSLGSFAQVHSHPEVGLGWYQRVEFNGKSPRQKVYIPPQNTEETEIGIPKQVSEFLHGEPGLNDRLKIISNNCGSSSWELRLAFSILSRGQDYLDSILLEGNGDAEYVTHPNRHFLRESSSSISSTEDNYYNVLARLLVSLAERYPMIRDPEIFVHGVRRIRDSEVVNTVLRNKYLRVCDELYKSLIDDEGNLLIQPVYGESPMAWLDFFKALKKELLQAFDPLSDLGRSSDDHRLAAVLGGMALASAATGSAATSSEIPYDSLAYYMAAIFGGAHLALVTSKYAVEYVVSNVDVFEVDKLRYQVIACGVCQSLLDKSSSKCPQCNADTKFDASFSNSLGTLRNTLGKEIEKLSNL